MLQKEEEDSGRGVDPRKEDSLTSHLPLSEEEDHNYTYEGEGEESAKEQFNNDGKGLPLFDWVDKETSQRSQHSRRGLLSPGGFRRSGLFHRVDSSFHRT